MSDKKPQSLVHIGSKIRDQLEAIGNTYTPPVRWQDLARQVLKNFTAMQVLSGAVKGQLRLVAEEPNTATGTDAQ